MTESLDKISKDILTYIHKEIESGIRNALVQLEKDPELIEREIKRLDLHLATTKKALDVAVGALDKLGNEQLHGVSNMRKLSLDALKQIREILDEQIPRRQSML